MSKFLETIKERAKADKKTIILPESMDRRTYEAAEKALKEDIANIIIIGTPQEIEEYGRGFDISGAVVISFSLLFTEAQYSDSRRSISEGEITVSVAGSGRFSLSRTWLMIKIPPPTSNTRTDKITATAIFVFFPLFLGVPE